MFSKRILGREKNEIIENDWSIYRSDMRDNSACRKWKSEFKTRGKGCTSIELNLDGYDKSRYFDITIALNSREHINFFKDYIQKNVALSSKQIHQSYSFPCEISFEAIALNSPIAIQILEAINAANTIINPEKPIVLPMKTLKSELQFISCNINASIDQIQRNWAKSY